MLRIVRAVEARGAAARAAAARAAAVRAAAARAAAGLGCMYPPAQLASYKLAGNMLQVVS